MSYFDFFFPLTFVTLFNKRFLSMPLNAVFGDLPGRIPYPSTLLVGFSNRISKTRLYRVKCWPPISCMTQGSYLTSLLSLQQNFCEN